MNFQIVIDSLTRILTDILNFIPSLANGLIILLVGYLIALLVRWLLRVVLQRAHVDPLIERSGVTGSLRGLGVTTPVSTILAQTVFSFLLLSFFITATRLMGLEAVARLLEQLLGFLPNVIAALIVFLLGGVVAQFMGTLVTNLAATGGLTYAPRLGRFLQYFISVFVAILALGVLGLNTALLVTAVTILIASFGLALALGLGLGSRTLIHHLLAGYYVRQRFPLGQTVTLAETRGEIQGIGSVNTVVATAEGKVVIPNGVLLETLVGVPRDEPPGPA